MGSSIDIKLVNVEPSLAHAVLEAYDRERIGDEVDAFDMWAARKLATPVGELVETAIREKLRPAFQAALGRSIRTPDELDRFMEAMREACRMVSK